MNFRIFLEKNEKSVLFLLIFASMVLKTFYLIFENHNNSLWGDDIYYINAANQISIGNWFDNNPLLIDYLIVGPTLPILGAIFIWFFNDMIIPFYVYNILITGIMVPVLFYLGKIIFNLTTAWFMAIWSVFFIETFKYTPHILKEPTLFLFMPLTILLVVKAVKSEKHRIKNIILASISYAILIHTDERFFIYYPFFVLYFLLIKPIKFSFFAKSSLLWLICVGFLMVPWTIRNFIVFDQIVILSPRTTAFTSKVWGENLAGSASHFSDEIIKHQVVESRKQNAYKFGKDYGVMPREYSVREAQVRALINFWQPTYFQPTFIQYGFRPQKWSLEHNFASLFFYGIFLPFYLIGIVQFVIRKNLLGLFLALFPIIHSLIHAYMVWPLERYRSPVTFIVVIVGVYTGNEVLNKLRELVKKMD